MGAKFESPKLDVFKPLLKPLNIDNKPCFETAYLDETAKQLDLVKYCHFGGYFFFFQI
jgi:hypothetical protein